MAVTVKIECQFVLPISRSSDKDSFVLCMYTCTYIHTQSLMVRNSYNQPSKCQTKIIPGQPFVLAKVKCYRIYPEILATFLIWQFGDQDQNRQISITKFI